MTPLDEADLIAALATAATAIESVIRNRPQTESAPTNIALDRIAKDARHAIARALKSVQPTPGTERK
jgi:hypothetical protein